MTVRRSIAALAVLLCLCLPAVAADLKTELAGGFSYADSDAAQTYTLAFDLQAPLGKILQVGPAVHLTGIDPADGESVNLVQVGGRATLALTGRDGLYAAATALYLTGDGDGYLLVPEIGVRWGGDGGAVRVGVSRPYAYSSEDGAVDLETTAITAALLLRF